MLLVLVAGCSQAKEAAGGVASSAAAKAGQAATDEVKRQVCAQVQDRQISAQNKQVLKTLLPVAKSAGLPPEVTAALDQVAQSGDQTPVEAVDALRRVCPSPTPSP